MVSRPTSRHQATPSRGGRAGPPPARAGEMGGGGAAGAAPGLHHLGSHRALQPRAAQHLRLHRQPRQRLLNQRMASWNHEELPGPNAPKLHTPINNTTFHVSAVQRFAKQDEPSGHTLSIKHNKKNETFTEPWVAPPGAAGGSPRRVFTGPSRGLSKATIQSSP